MACTQQCGCGRDKGLFCTSQGTVRFNRSKYLYVIIGGAPISSQAKFCLAAFLLTVEMTNMELVLESKFCDR
ncbi:50S ribosomal protein L27 [Coprococcus sp. TF11-13]|uniref:50S ribosomal protein L27 n=1 Tax=Coprococcus sp. TF11-13 TaxID=2293096 RepID=UPI003FA45CF1